MGTSSNLIIVLYNYNVCVRYNLKENKVSSNSSWLLSKINLPQTSDSKALNYEIDHGVFQFHHGMNMHELDMAFTLQVVPLFVWLL